MLFNSVEYLIILPMMLNLDSTKISMLSRCKHIFHFEIVAMMMGGSSGAALLGDSYLAYKARTIAR